MNSSYHNSQPRTYTPPLSSNAPSNPSLFSNQGPFCPVIEGQQEDRLLPMQQEQQQPATLPSQPHPTLEPQAKREQARSHSQEQTLLPAALITPNSLRNTDTISLRSLSTQAVLGPDSWARQKPQPLLISLYLTIDTTPAARSDNIAQTFNYSLMAKDVLGKISGKEFMSIDHLTSDLGSLADNWPGETLRIVARAPKALLRTTEGLERELCLQRREHKTAGEGKQLVWHVLRHEWGISGLRISCIIGVNEHERVEKQDVLVRIRAMGERDKEEYGAQIREGGEMWRRLVRGICDAVESSSFQTLEALAAHVARYCLEYFPFPQVTVGIEKPSALAFVEGAGVEITRDRRSLSVR